jgi:DNA helicase-2/ATP-dependent DNA helicase PcrA
MARTESVHDLLCAVIERTGYREYLREDPATAETRLENIDELLVETQRFVAISEDAGLAAFLEEIALISDIDYLKEEETVALMTLHNSKGLEYPIVIITGLEDGLLPHYSSFDSGEELEEERRLFYVGITRAKERVCLFSAANRMRFGSWSGNPPSRFLEEIPAHLYATAGGRGSGGSAAELFKRVDTMIPAGDEGGRSVARKRFYVGAFISHPSYGEGTIKKVEGSGKEMMVTVQFPGKGTKRFLACYAPFRFSR